jgi:hypothetical protein
MKDKDDFKYTVELYKRLIDNAISDLKWRNFIIYSRRK